MQNLEDAGEKTAQYENRVCNILHLDKLKYYSNTENKATCEECFLNKIGDRIIPIEQFYEQGLNCLKLAQLKTKRKSESLTEQQQIRINKIYEHTNSLQDMIQAKSLEITQWIKLTSIDSVNEISLSRAKFLNNLTENLDQKSSQFSQLKNTLSQKLSAFERNFKDKNYGAMIHILDKNELQTIESLAEEILSSVSKADFPEIEEDDIILKLKEKISDHLNLIPISSSSPTPPQQNEEPEIIEIDALPPSLITPKPKPKPKHPIKPNPKPSQSHTIKSVSSLPPQSITQKHNKSLPKPTQHTPPNHSSELHKSPSLPKPNPSPHTRHQNPHLTTTDTSQHTTSTIASIASIASSSAPTLHFFQVPSNELFLCNTANSSGVRIHILSQYKIPLNFASLSLDNVLYISGGDKDDGSHLKQTLQLNPPNYNQLVKKDEMYLEKRQHSLVGIKQKFIYSLGGFNQMVGHLGICEKYDIVNDTWALIPSMKIPKRSISALIFANSIIFTFGGFAETSLQTVEKFFINNETVGWMEVNFKGEDWTPRRVAAAAQISDKEIFIFGGADKKSKGDAFIFNVEEATFVKKSNMFKEEHFYQRQCIASGNEVLAIGYEFQDIHKYNILTNEWNIVPKESWQNFK